MNFRILIELYNFIYNLENNRRLRNQDLKMDQLEGHFQILRILIYNENWIIDKWNQT